MKDQIKSFLNEDQDPKAIEKITSKLTDLLMRGEEIAYIGVQKKPAITVMPDSVVLTNKRIIVCKPKNLGLSMDFTEYEWQQIEAVFVKENILGSEFTFTTKTELTLSIDYIPKNQAKKLYTYAKQALQDLNTPDYTAEQTQTSSSVHEAEVVDFVDVEEYTTEEVAEIEEVPTEEVTHFAELMAPKFAVEHVVESIAEGGMPAQSTLEPAAAAQNTEVKHEKTLDQMTADELFAKLQQYKKLLDNGLIMQGEYDRLKGEVLKYM